MSEAVLLVDDERNVPQALKRLLCDEDCERLLAEDGIADDRATKERHRLEQLVDQQKVELEAWNHRLEEKVREQTEALRSQNRDLQELHGRLDQSLRDTVKLVAGIMEAHSPNLGIHCQRVAELAQVLAAQVGVDGVDLRDIGFAAQLHDIGHFAKTSMRMPVTASGIGTGAPVQPASHTETAYALLSTVSGFENIATAVRHVHENFDGTGTPCGLRRDEIPLSARIVAIANAYYKGALSADDLASFSHESGCQSLLRGKGTHLDPHLVDQILRYFGARNAAEHHIHDVEISSRRLQPGMTLSRPIHSVAGLLMLNENTRLTHELIDSIIRLGDVDPNTRSVFVRCTAQEVERQLEGTATSTEVVVPESH